MRYRRLHVPGASFFFTVVTWHRRPWFVDPDNVRLLGEVMRDVRRRRPFTTEAICVLPEHLHCVWRLPLEDPDFSTRWMLIKRAVTRAVRRRPGMADVTVWQPRYWERRLRDDRDVAAHCAYVHEKPVRHGWVRRPEDWGPSSVHRHGGACVDPEAI
jgi:putative transposase